MQEINLTVTLDEANLILEGLGNLSFKQVYALVGKIQDQAGQQLRPQAPAENGAELPSAIPVIAEGLDDE